VDSNTGDRGTRSRKFPRTATGPFELVVTLRWTRATVRDSAERSRRDVVEVGAVERD
jgi:hypothetical protein